MSIITAAGLCFTVRHHYCSPCTSPARIDAANGVTEAGIYSVDHHRRQAYSFALIVYILLIGVATAGTNNLQRIGTTGATPAPCPCRWLGRELWPCLFRDALFMAVTKAQQRPLAPL